jgi:hypothetical protein
MAASPPSPPAPPSDPVIRFVHFLPALFVAGLLAAAMGAVQGWSGVGAFGSITTPGWAGLILGSVLGFVYGFMLGVTVVGGMFLLGRWVGRSNVKGLVILFASVALILVMEGWPGIWIVFVNPKPIMAVWYGIAALLGILWFVGRFVYGKQTHQ